MIKSTSREKMGVKDIYPPLTPQKIKKIFNEYIGRDDLKLPKKIDLDHLPPNIEKILKDIYISKKLKTKEAILARFFQFLDFDHSLSKYEKIANDIALKSGSINMILQTKIPTTITVAVFVCETFDNKEFSTIKKTLIEYYQNQKGKSKKKSDKIYDFDEIFIISRKIVRKIAKDLSTIGILSKKINLNFFIEHIDPNRPFDDDDTILIKDLKIKGFNLGSLEDVLSVVKKEKGKGKYKIFKKNLNGIKDKIWEGLIFPKELLNSKN